MTPPDEPERSAAPTSAPAAGDAQTAAAQTLTLGGDDLARLEAHLLGFLPEGPYRCTVPGDVVLNAGDRVGLRDPEGVLIAALGVLEREVHGESWSVSGILEVIELPRHEDLANLRRSAAEIRDLVHAAGRSRVLGYVPGQVLHRGIRSALVQRALELDATLLVLIGAAPGEHDELDSYFRARSLEVSAAELPSDRTVMAVVPSPRDVGSDYAARIAQAAGATHLAWHDERPGVSDGGTMEACCDRLGLVCERIEPHGGSTAAGYQPASDFPGWLWTDAADALLSDAERTAARRAYPAPTARGFTVFFTGLSGSGKSTIARALRIALMERTGRPVTLLDGDRVRRHLSAELGFSREHRDRNVLRIGWVAAEISRHGGIAVCAPIAPYEAIRQQVRRMIEPIGGFLLVHVATPLDACEARDRKGLYARARAGLIPQFTGITDPYEPPSDAAVSIDTRTTSVEAAVAMVLAALASRHHVA